MRTTRTLINELSSSKDLCDKLADQAGAQGSIDDQNSLRDIAALIQDAIRASLEQDQSLKYVVRDEIR